MPAEFQMRVFPKWTCMRQWFQRAALMASKMSLVRSGVLTTYMSSKNASKAFALMQAGLHLAQRGVLPHGV